jgi:cobalt/nickel transport system permease protein
VVEESFSDGHSLMHRLDPRVKMIVACVFSIIVATADRFLPLTIAALLALFFISLAKLPFKKVCSRLLVVNGLILLLWLFLPFTMEGEPLWAFGPLIVTKEGIIYSALITIKSNSIILAFMALVATMPVLTIGRTMGHLHIPEKMVHLFYFTYRYIHAIRREYRRQMNAIKIRGFNPGTNMHTYRTYAYLIGMLLVKSHDRAERVRAAMICRGFKGKFYDLKEFSFRSSDLIIMIFMLLAIIGIGFLQWTKIIY